MRLSVILLTIISTLFAQQPPTQQTPAQQLASEKAFLEYQIERQHDDAAAPKLAEQRAAKEREREFCRKADDFVALWGQLASEMNANGTMNAKLAKRVSKAFHDLEHSDGWPAR